MQLIQLQGVLGSFRRCSCCEHWTRPAIVGIDRFDGLAKIYCFRCYHVLQGVAVAPFEQGGGESHVVSA